MRDRLTSLSHLLYFALNLFESKDLVTHRKNIHQIPRIILQVRVQSEGVSESRAPVTLAMALPTRGRVIVNTTAGELDIELWSRVRSKLLH